MVKETVGICVASEERVAREEDAFKRCLVGCLTLHNVLIWQEWYRVGIPGDRGCEDPSLAQTMRAT